MNYLKKEQNKQPVEDELVTPGCFPKPGDPLGTFLSYYSSNCQKAHTQGGSASISRINQSPSSCSAPDDVTEGARSDDVRQRVDPILAQPLYPPSDAPW